MHIVLELMDHVLNLLFFIILPSPSSVVLIRHYFGFAIISNDLRFSEFTNMLVTEKLMQLLLIKMMEYP